MDLDYNQIYTSLRAIVPPGSVFELRMLGERKGQIDSGYFDDPAQAANALVSAGGYYKGVYFTPNPVVPDTLARAYNRVKPWAQWTTDDKEVTRRRWLLVDIDARRVRGISSSEAEHEAALNAARTIAAVLTMMYGFPEPIISDSGNGAHMMYRLDEENSETVRDEIHTFLRILKKQYDSDKIDMDTTVYNAARIWRVPGTWARKGDSTPDRPHRRAQIIKSYDAFQKPLSIITVMRYNASNQHLLAGENTAPSQNKNKNEYPADEIFYKRLNEYAMRNVKAWVPVFFPGAVEYKEGYRIASSEIGEAYEEDLTIHPWPLGIKYFGIGDQGDSTEGRRTPVGVVAQYGLRTVDKGLAAKKLADTLNYPVTDLGAIPPQTTLNAGFSGGSSIMGTNGRAPISFKGIRSIADLGKKQFKQVHWIVKDVIPAGNMLLAARPKMRKTWLALQLALAVTRGRNFLGYETNKSDVLFLGLEDNERRIQNRIRTLTKFDMDVGDLSGFRYWTGGYDYNGAGQLVQTNPEEEAELLKVFPRGEEGAAALDQFLTEFPLTKLIIIDTLAHFRGDRHSRDVYESDYKAMMPLTKVAAKHDCCMIPVTHEKKGNADRGVGADFLEDVTGSAGISGGADGVISIKGRRGVQEENESRKLFVSGRDVPFDYELDISFDAETGGWHKAAKEDVKVAIRGILTLHPFLNRQDIQNLLPNAGQGRLYRALTDMKLAGEVEQGKFGYSLKR